MTRLNTPGGIPAREMISVNACADPGTSSAGLNTTVFPQARAGAIFQAGIATGKFQGVMSPTTPTGSRVISTSTPARTDGSFSPARRRHSPAKNWKICPARVTSPIPSGRVLPSSRERSRPSSSFRERISAAIALRQSCRVWMVERDQARKASNAASIARSTSLAEACANSPTTSDVFEGFTFGTAFDAASHSPAM